MMFLTLRSGFHSSSFTVFSSSCFILLSHTRVGSGPVSSIPSHLTIFLVCFVRIYEDRTFPYTSKSKWDRYFLSINVRMNQLLLGRMRRKEWRSFFKYYFFQVVQFFMFLVALRSDGMMTLCESGFPLNSVFDTKKTIEVANEKQQRWLRGQSLFPRRTGVETSRTTRRVSSKSNEVVWGYVFIC